MEFDSLIPFFAINLICGVLAWLVALRSRFYRPLIDEVAKGRAQMIDGLRGWLALGVFFTHAVAMHVHFTNGTWDIPQGAFYQKTGEVGVSLFFMITGFLFWGRVLRSGGTLDAKPLYVSRLRRIVPMYLVSVLMALVVVAVQSGFTLSVTLPSLAQELRPWFSFGFMRAGEINGIADAHHINSVYWTLAYEWGFYIALPFLALLARGRGNWILFSIAFLYALNTPVTLNFIFGALTAILVERGLIAGWLQSWLLTPLAVGLLGAVFAFPSAFALSPILLMFVFFLFVVGNNSLFGLLASRAARLLGTVSYSIYLIHCIVVYSVIIAVNVWLPIRSLEPHQYWLVAAVAAVLAVAISLVTYRYVEHPFLSRKTVAKERVREQLAPSMGAAL